MRILRTTRVITALLVCSGLWGCAADTEAPQADFHLRGPDGLSRVVRTQAIDDGSTIGLDGSDHGTLYTVEGGLPAASPEQVLLLALDGGAGARIGFIDAAGRGRLQRTLPAEANALMIVEVPLPAEPDSPGFLVLPQSGKPEPRIASAAVGRRSAAFDYRAEGVRLGADIELQGFDWADRRSARLGIPADFTERMDGQPWSIDVRFEPDVAGVAQGGGPQRGRGYTSGTIRFSSARQSRSLQLVLTPGNRQLHFGNGTIGFVPQTIEIEVEAGMAIANVTARKVGYVGADSSYPAIPADLGVINYYDQRAWRHRPFELFSWNAAEYVLIFDFADLDIQRDMFGRLGFFVAVAGEAGQIFAEEYYEGRHTYNAHDYRPQDLVPFFSLAEETGVALNERERFLREVLIDYGIIHRDAGGYREGHGAVLSFSRATWRPLRQRLLRHEAMHGIFYVSERFREGAFELWQEMSPLQQEYWRLFLGNKGRMDGREGYDGYDIDRLYLLVNEMQAHVLQLHPHEVNPYFRDFYAQRIREVAPQSAHVVDELIATEPDAFVNTRRRLELLLEEVSGIRGGYMLSVYPDNVEILHD